MEVTTSCFGTVSYTKEDTIHFPNGIFGFPQWKEYLPLPFDKDSDQMLYLQSIEEESISFILMNPFMLLPNYQPSVTGEDMEMLDCQDEQDLSFYVISVIHEPLEDSTVNLKCPIAVNVKNHCAIQLILDHPDYTFRHRLRELSCKEE